MNEKETNIQIIQVSEENGHPTMICPHVAHTLSEIALPRVGGVSCQKCMFSEGVDLATSPKTAKCSCEGDNLDPVSIFPVLANIGDKYKDPNAKFDYDEEMDSMEKSFSSAHAVSDSTENPIEGLLRAISGEGKQKSNPMDKIAELMMVMREEGAIPAIEISSEELQQKSIQTVGAVWGGLQKGMSFIGKMAGNEIKKLHEKQVYDLLEEKIAARRKELELL